MKVNILFKKCQRLEFCAKNVQAAWNSIPHVTHFDEINMSNINRAKEKNNANPLAFMIKALSETLKEFPIFNSS